MAQPIIVEIPHQLGKAEARGRIDKGAARLADHIPGGAEVTTGWQGDRMTIEVTTMGQAITGHVDVLDEVVRVEFQLPMLLGLFAGAIEQGIRKAGPKLLR